MRTEGVRKPVRSMTAAGPSSIRVPSAIRSRSWTALLMFLPSSPAATSTPTSSGGEMRGARRGPSRWTGHGRRHRAGSAPVLLVSGLTGPSRARCTTWLLNGRIEMHPVDRAGMAANKVTAVRSGLGGNRRSGTIKPPSCAGGFFFWLALIRRHSPSLVRGPLGGVLCARAAAWRDRRAAAAEERALCRKPAGQSRWVMPPGPPPTSIGLP